MNFPSELERTALHESGHAVAAFMLGVGVRAVSIVPSEHYAGVTILGRRAPHQEPNLLSYLCRFSPPRSDA